MNEIKLFLALSGKLKEERDEIEKFISRFNDDLIQQKIYVKLVIWEKLSGKFSKDRKQEDFNVEVLKSDIFICLIHDKIGAFSKEEYDAAYEGFKKQGKPELIYIYFSDKEVKPSEITKDFQSVLDLKSEISKNHQFYRTYNSKEALIYSISRDLNSDLHDLSIFSPKLKMLKILEKSNHGITEFLDSNDFASVEVTGTEFDQLKEIESSLLKTEVASFKSNGNMMVNRADGHMRTGLVIIKCGKY